MVHKQNTMHNFHEMTCSIVLCTGGDGKTGKMMEVKGWNDQVEGNVSIFASIQTALNQ